MTSAEERLRRIMDPEGVLPNVNLVAITPMRPFCSHEITDTDGETVGELCFVDGDDMLEGTAWMGSIELAEEYKGRGLGSAAYIAAIGLAHSRAENFRTDMLCLSEDAVKVWQRFIDAGVARVISPLIPTCFNMQGKPTHYDGHVEIPPLAG